VRRIASLLIAAALLQGCSFYHMARFRDPHPDQQSKIFPERIVHHATTPFRFTRATNRNDLDTVGVRDSDGRLKPFAQYVVDHKIRAFVVIRNDTIVYEKYRDYKPSELWSSYSAAKSIRARY
jgi:hypothetical protein